VEDGVGFSHFKRGKYRLQLQPQGVKMQHLKIAASGDTYMTDLVVAHKGDAYSDSQIVADKFGHRHQYVVASIRKLMAEFAESKGAESLPLNFAETEREYRGQKFKAFLMDRRAFSLLAMRFSGKRALEWQIKFNDAFYLMERRLLLEQTNKNNVEWATQREQGKLARKDTTDTIKEFVDYALSQGSSNAHFYYKHVTLACYRCLELIQSEKPKLRDTLSIMELNQLMLAEHVAERSIRKHMASGEHYKAIFSLVKADLERFAEGLLIERPKLALAKEPKREKEAGR
jgi:Rha family phage regulatory protein